MARKEKNPGNELAQFFIGLVMFCVGGYLFLQNVKVIDTANLFAFSLSGRRMDGLVFVPLIASIIFLFYKYNIVSKICCGLSLFLIVANVISNLSLHWSSISLFSTIVMFVLLFGGMGLLARVLFANPEGNHGKQYNQYSENAYASEQKQNKKGRFGKTK